MQNDVTAAAVQHPTKKRLAVLAILHQHNTNHRLAVLAILHQHNTNHNSTYSSLFSNTVPDLTISNPARVGLGQIQELKSRQVQIWGAHNQPTNPMHGTVQARKLETLNSMWDIEYSTPPPQNDLSIFYSTVTINFDILIPKSQGLISFPRSIISVSLVEICLIFFKISCLEFF